MRVRPELFSLILALGWGMACGGDDAADDEPSVTTEHCEYRPMVATAGAGGTVTSATLEAGAAESLLAMPVGSALGSYTARAGFLGSAGTVDNRKVALSGNFNPSIGVESAPRARALVLTAGAETVVIVKLDIGFPYEGMVYDLEERLGAEFAGKVVISASHSHSSWGHYSAHSAYLLGAGVMRDLSYQRFLDVMEATVDAAMSARRPAKLGYFVDMDFDPDDLITRDRRGENNDLMGGPRKDDAFFLLRVDGIDDEPIAVLPIYGVHGTISGEDNSLASTDAPGAVEHLLEEQFDSKVVVMHLQGAGADVSPKGYGGTDCSVAPGNDGDPCFNWLPCEGNARAAVPVMMAAWQAAGTDMVSEIELEAVTRSVELGPYPETFTIRDGALTYAPFDYEREADGVMWNDDGSIATPIDEFNAPVGAALCEDDDTIYYVALIPGTEDLIPYGTCALVNAMDDIFSILLDFEFESDDTHPICQSTRTTLSSLRIGDLVLATLPGEVSMMVADLVRERSPVAADRTIVLGYAQGEVGYIMVPEDWMQGGYESSINIWGPLEGEYLVERLAEVMTLVTTSEREDASSAGSDRFVTPAVTDDLVIDDPAPLAGTIPEAVPEGVWVRSGTPSSAQPQASLRRVSGIATFVWIGDDPLTVTPVVTLERETSPDSGSFAPVERRSGRLVQDTELLLEYTPQPVRRVEGEPQTHYWAVEWQLVPWAGAVSDGGDSLDSMGARAGVPLGAYRFHVHGKDYELTSEPFTVTSAELGVAASRAGTTISATVSLHAARGYRLLDLQGDSNVPVRVREGLFAVTLTLSGGGTREFTDVAISAEGVVGVDAGNDAADVTGVTITDAHGNSRSVGL